MLVDVSIDRRGCVTITPKSTLLRIRTEAFLYAARMAGEDCTVSGSVWIQDNADDFLSTLSASAQRDLAAGWDAEVRMDFDTWCGLVGYNALDCNLEEKRWRRP